MKTLGLSDVIGPIMVGPSSSHTAGALRIAYMARRLCLAEPKTVEFRLLGSFAHTLTGHGTDKALVAGMLGLAADDLRIRDSFQLAGDAGLAFSFVTLPDAEYDHPNTIDMHIVDAAGNAMSVRGESIGGGAAVIRKIDDIDVRITGESTSIVVRQRDETGVLAHIAQSISDEGVNIATTRMYRERKGDIAYTVLETDQEVDGAAKAAIEDHPAILDVRVIPGDARPGCGSVDAPDAEEALQRFAEADFGTGAALLAWCEKHGTTLSEAFLAREAALAESLGYADRSLAYLHETLDVMKCAAQRPIDEALPSMGGLIGGEARKLADLRDGGMALEELRDWTEQNRLKLHHWFFSTDLTFYVRGGRISKASGWFGTMLHICPLLNMDDLGRLIPRFKIRGKNKVIREIAERMVEHAQDGLNYSGKCYISNSACMEDAQAVARLVEERFPKLNGKVEINSIGTTIGSHTGPGTVALFFWGDERVR